MQALIAEKVHRKSLYPKQWSATFASIFFVQCRAKVFDIMQKTVFNVAQKWP